MPNEHRLPRLSPMLEIDAGPARANVILRLTHACGVNFSTEMDYHHLRSTPVRVLQSFASGPARKEAVCFSTSPVRAAIPTDWKRKALVASHMTGVRGHIAFRDRPNSSSWYEINHQSDAIISHHSSNVPATRCSMEAAERHRPMHLW